VKSIDNFIVMIQSNNKDQRTHAIIGAAMEVHRIIGPGHLEAVYQECLEIEFKLRNIPFISQPKLNIYYKDRTLTRIINVSDKWITFRYKDYADNSKISSKTMGTFTFITYLTQHIPDKYFRVVRGYGIFSNRLRGRLIPKLLKYFKKKKSNRKKIETWRDRILKLTGRDPLYCNKCNIEMELFFVCFKISKEILARFKIKEDKGIPFMQYKI